MEFDQRGAVGEQGVEFRVLKVCVPCVGARKAAQGIWDDVFFAWLVADVKFKLLEKLRCPHKLQIEPHH